MKITKIEVKKLFGIFDHEIPLKTKDHITIIHGPNGYGKTILLTLVNEIFNSQYYKIFEIPFSELTISFDNKSKLCVKKNIDAYIPEGKRPENGDQLNLELLEPRSKIKTGTIKQINPESMPFPLSYIEREIPDLERISPSTWLYLPTGERLPLGEVLTRFEFEFPRSLIDVLNRKVKGEAPWFKEIKEFLDIHFIETQRLLRISHIPGKREFEERASMGPVVLKYSDELAEAIRSKLAEYGSLSQSLDRTFPTRLVKEKKEHSSRPTIKEKLEKDLSELESKRSRLIAAGFLDQEQDLEDKDLQKVDDSNIDVLSVYIQDVKQKLSVFDDLTERIDLLVKIINSRFLYKQLSISKKAGFVFKTKDEKILPTTSLSSGEQHELVLLYELLFKVKANSLILIDEPEISLHVAWQQEFLKDLQEITRLVGFDVLIATHSPQIINDRWDLTVELQGPK
jgi:predicted ATP-binding protein involved in virulence